MKTKPFLLATSGKTVDGREINPDWLRQMAKNYDPKTYGARLNIEHIRGLSGTSPFMAYGDVLELSVKEDHEVVIAGKTEKRTALFGIFEVTDDAKKLNDAGQKVYPSVEIDLDFAGNGEAYMMGCALTDSPASIGTDRMTFNRTAPGHETVKDKDLGGTLEFADPEPAATAAADEVKSFFSKLTELVSGTAPKQEPKTDPQPQEPQQFDAATFTKELGETLENAFAKQSQLTKSAIDAIEGKVEALSQVIENTEEPGQGARPAATGASGNQFSAEF